MWISNILRTIILLFIVLDFLLWGRSVIEGKIFSFANYVTYFLILCLLLEVFLFIQVGKKNKYSILLILCVSIILTYIQQIFVIIAFNYFRYSHLAIPSPTEINKTLTYIVMGNALFFSGIILSNKTLNTCFVSVHKSSDFLFKNRKVLINISIIVLIFNYFLFFLFQIGICGIQNPSWAWITHFIELFPFLVLNIVYLVVYKNILKKKIKIVIYIFGYILLTFLQGHRSAFYIPMSLWLICSIITRGNFKISMRVFLFLGTLIIVGVFIIFPLATGIRYWHWGKFSLNEVLNIINSTHFLGIILSVSNRVGGFDRLVIVVNNWCFNSKIIHISDSIKVILNSLSPIDFFPNVMTLGKAFTYIVWNKPIDIVEAGNWSGFGVMYIYFGWYKALLALFILGFLLNFIFYRLNFLGQGFSLYLKTLFVYLFFFSGYATGSFDTIVALFIWSVIYMFILLIVSEILVSVSTFRKKLLLV